MGKLAALDKEAAYMAYIHVDQLDKTYRISQRSKGALGAIKGFFRPNYTQVEALSQVSFDIAPGEVVGYIGPNGAGKSTTVKILSASLCRTEGRLRGRTYPLETAENPCVPISAWFSASAPSCGGCAGHRFL